MTSALNCHISLELQDSSRSQQQGYAKKKGEGTCPLGLPSLKLSEKTLKSFFLRWQVYTNREVFFF
jgi:hypothetical protein